MVTALDIDRGQLTGLHFAQDMMRKHEQATLHLAERMLRRIDAALSIHRPEKDGMGYRPDGSGYGSIGTVCSACETANEDGVLWPCPTVRALGVAE